MKFQLNKYLIHKLEFLNILCKWGHMQKSCCANDKYMDEVTKKGKGKEKGGDGGKM